MLNRRHLTGLAPIAMALALTGAAFAATGMASQDTPLRCEIEVTQTGGMISLVGLVEADQAMAGSYSFAVESSGGSGSSNIRQGGGFSVAPGETVTLGRSRATEVQAMISAPDDATASTTARWCP